MNALRDLHLVPEKTEEAPIVVLLNQISDLDEAKTVAIARTLNQASLFNEVVREQVSAMALGERYDEITDAFSGGFGRSDSTWHFPEPSGGGFGGGGFGSGGEIRGGGFRIGGGF
jgi:uncharacterized membrane protein YgcG